MDLQLNHHVRRETDRHNETVKKNREILKRLMDCAIFLCKQEFSLRGHNERKESTNKGNYMELLSLLAKHNTDFHFYLSTNKVFPGTSGKIQSDLISAEVVTEEIRREVNQAPFVAVDETTAVSNSSQLALVLRDVTSAAARTGLSDLTMLPAIREPMTMLLFSSDS